MWQAEGSGRQDSDHFLISLSTLTLELSSFFRNPPVFCFLLSSAVCDTRWPLRRWTTLRSSDEGAAADWGGCGGGATCGDASRLTRSGLAGRWLLGEGWIPSEEGGERPQWSMWESQTAGIKLSIIPQITQTYVEHPSSSPTGHGWEMGASTGQQTDGLWDIGVLPMT